MMLLEAFEIVRKAVPNAKLLLVGPEHDNGALRRFIESKGLQNDVLLLGWRSDVPVLLHLSDVYVASSKSEGLGLNLIEAMACGVPVVATKNRGHLEIVSHEANGFLVDINDYEEMAAYVLRLRNDAELRSRITRQAQLDIEKFGTDAAIQELMEMVVRYA
jgi:glycosyltransferase EpsD